MMGKFASVLALSILLMGPVSAGRMLRFASPLQSLTIPDPEVKQEMETKRQNFLGKFKAGLQAETEARRELAASRTKELQAAAASGTDWAERAAESEKSGCCPHGERLHGPTHIHPDDGRQREDTATDHVGYHERTGPDHAQIADQSFALWGFCHGISGAVEPG